MKFPKWTKSSWRSFPVRQQPAWPNAHECEDTLKMLSQLPALVFAGESRELKLHLVKAAEGKAFVLHCGDCAEDFSRWKVPFE